MTDDWNTRVAEFWESADDGDPESLLAGMRALVAERGEDEPDAIFEWASAHDFLGRETEAIPLYRAALAAGLGGDRRAQAVIQLASSLRNVGEPEAAVDLLRDLGTDAGTGAAVDAFLSLALHDSGHPAEALRVALRALAPTLPMYRRSVEFYADELRAD